MKKTKKALTIILSLSMLIGSSITSFAGNWQQNETGKWWQNDDGSYPANTWQWLDGNGDGVSECYYFDGNGYMLANTTTPDGYQVNADGAWVVNGAVQTQGTSTQNTSGVNHNAGYDPAHPLAGKIDEWNLRLPSQYLSYIYICNNNVQAMLTGQMDQYFAAPVGEWINPETGTRFYTEQEDYDWARNNEQVLYEWFCNWLNSMDFENMSEMERAREIQKVLASAEYYNYGENTTKDTDKHILIDKKGKCAEFAMTATSLAKALGLKSGVGGSGNHMVYYIQVDGIGYCGSNNILNLDMPITDYIYFQ